MTVAIRNLIIGSIVLTGVWVTVILALASHGKFDFSNPKQPTKFAIDGSMSTKNEDVNTEDEEVETPEGGEVETPEGGETSQAYRHGPSSYGGQYEHVSRNHLGQKYVHGGPGSRAQEARTHVNMHGQALEGSYMGQKYMHGGPGSRAQEERTHVNMHGQAMEGSYMGQRCKPCSSRRRTY
jgi:hypothetical protein